MSRSSGSGDPTARRRTIRSILTVGIAALALVGSVVVTDVLHPAHAGAAVVTGDDAKVAPLLLIHGFNDYCGGAFDTDGPRSTDTTTRAYLTQSVGFLQIDRVGYYTSSANTTDDRDATPGVCDSNLNQLSGTYPEMQACNNISSTGYGTKDDRLERLSCLLAWFVYRKYTSPLSGQPRAVNVLAHSMGGLLIRAAIGWSGARANFPPAPLRVLRVVTVSTPHGGVDGGYRFWASQFDWSNGAELDDMQPGSAFMNGVNGLQKPQGAGGTYWALVGAADGQYGGPGCLITPSGWQVSAGNVVSCYALGDGDGVVATASQMGMSADYKIEYGVRVTQSCPVGGCFFVPDEADHNTQYEHEVDMPCVGPPIASLCVDFTSVDFLNDASTAGTKAWLCGSGCSGTGRPGGSPVNVSRSLVTIGSLLKHPAITDVSGGGQFATLWQQRGGTLDSMPLSYSYGVTGGQRQDFMRSDGQLAMLWSSATATHEVHGAIYQKYAQFNGSTGYGFPSTDQLTTADGIGRYNHFSGGRSIFWHPTYGAHAVYGAIRDKWSSLGWERSLLGYPVSDETDAGNGGRASYFAGQKCNAGGPYGSGSAIYSSSGGTHEVHGCIYAKYQASGGPSGSGLGFPVSDEYNLGGTPRSDFQCGYILWINGGEIHRTCGATNYLGPSVMVLENNTPNCPGTQQYFNTTDGNGYPISWTYANGSYSCIQVSWDPVVASGRQCSYDFYVPKGHATANVRFDIWYLFDPVNDIYKKYSLYLNEAPVDGWQHLFTDNDIITILVLDSNGQTGTQIGWGSQAAHSFRQSC